MAIPSTAETFADTMDPADEIDFEVDAYDASSPSTSLLETGELIASHTVELGPEALAVGMILGTTTRAPSLINGGTGVKFWLTVNPANQSDAGFDGDGVSVPVVVTIVTDSSPSRTRQRTFLVKVAQR